MQPWMRKSVICQIRILSNTNILYLNVRYSVIWYKSPTKSDIQEDELFS